MFRDLYNHDPYEEERKAIQNRLVVEEQAGRKLNHFVCPVCGNERHVIQGHLHEWLFKRSDNVSDEITFSEENMIVLCGCGCHENTKDVDEACLNFKLNYYDVYGWVRGLLETNQIKHWPERLPREQK